MPTAKLAIFPRFVWTTLTRLTVAETTPSGGKTEHVATGRFTVTRHAAGSKRAVSKILTVMAKTPARSVTAWQRLVLKPPHVKTTVAAETGGAFRSPVRVQRKTPRTSRVRIWRPFIKRPWEREASEAMRTMERRKNLISPFFFSHFRFYFQKCFCVFVVWQRSRWGGLFILVGIGINVFFLMQVVSSLNHLVTILVWSTSITPFLKFDFAFQLAPLFRKIYLNVVEMF